MKRKTSANESTEKDKIIAKSSSDTVTVIRLRGCSVLTLVPCKAIFYKKTSYLQFNSLGSRIEARSLLLMGRI